MRRLGSCFVAVVALVVGACSSSEDLSEESRAAIEFLDETDQLDALNDATQEQRDCVVEAVAGEFSNTNEVFTAEGQERVTRIQLDCIPNLTELESYREASARAFSAAAGVEIDADQMGCIFDEVFDNADDPVAALSASSDDIEIVIDAIGTCIPQEAFDEAAAALPAERGDDPLADDLYERCEAGEGAACELLVYETADGSELFTLGQECAGRGTFDGGGCIEGLVYDEAGAVTADSPALDLLADACRDGDLVACDLLFTVSQVGSDFEEIGYTCGGRISTGGLPNCRTRLGD